VHKRTDAPIARSYDDLTVATGHSSVVSTLVAILVALAALLVTQGRSVER
jgi:hypothetical protein